MERKKLIDSKNKRFLIKNPDLLKNYSFIHKRFGHVIKVKNNASCMKCFYTFKIHFYRKMIEW